WNDDQSLQLTLGPIQPRLGHLDLGAIVGLEEGLETPTRALPVRVDHTATGDAGGVGAAHAASPRAESAAGLGSDDPRPCSTQPRSALTSSMRLMTVVATRSGASSTRL